MIFTTKLLATSFQEILRHSLRKMKPEDVKKLERLSQKRKQASRLISKQLCTHLWSPAKNNVTPSEPTLVGMMESLKSLPSVPVSTCPSLLMHFTGSALGNTNVALKLVDKFLLPANRQLLVEQGIEN